MPRHSPLATHHFEAAPRLRLAFITSHPIQYQVPVFRLLAERDDIDLIVLFAMLPDAATQGAGFGVAFEWDLPLLEGYRYQVLNNVSKSPGVTHFSGCDTPEIRSVLQELQIDVVIVNGWVVKTCLQALWACKRLKIPCVVRGEANNLRPRSWWKKWIQRLLVRQYAAVLPIGSANREFYRSHGVSEARMFNAPYCIENERFSRAASQAECRCAELRAKWNIPQEAICFLYCGKFELKKHPVELVEAFLKAHQILLASPQLHRPVHLLMVGDGELRATCEAHVKSFLASRLSPLATVTFAGFLNQSEIVDSYVAADMLVLTSDAGETWGLVVNEAMACGRPAIVSDLVGCAADLIEPGQTGFRFPFADWSVLSGILVDMARKNVDWPLMRDACLRRIADFAPAVAASGMATAALHVARRVSADEPVK